MLQTFCIPTSGSDEADATTHSLRELSAVEREPVQGWQAWSEDIIAIIDACETQDALDRMRSRQAALLTAISREQAGLYVIIGEAFANWSQALAHPSPLVQTTGEDAKQAEHTQDRLKDAVDV